MADCFYVVESGEVNIMMKSKVSSFIFLFLLHCVKLHLLNSFNVLKKVQMFLFRFLFCIKLNAFSPRLKCRYSHTWTVSLQKPVN